MINEAIKQFLEQNVEHVEHVFEQDVFKLFGIREPLLRSEIPISTFQILLSDGQKSTLIRIVESTETETALYDRIAEYADNRLSFAFWIVKDGQILARTTAQKEFEPIDLEKFPFCYWIERTLAFEKQVLKALKEDGAVYVDALATRLNVSAQKVGKALQKLGVITERVYVDGKLRRRIRTSAQMLERIYERYK